MSGLAPELVVTEEPDEADRKVLLRRLYEFEVAAAGTGDPKRLAILLKDEAGATVGGLWGLSMFRWLIVELVFVPETMRGNGTGTRIMARAEEIARARGCIGVWLDTYSFQAPGFYAKLGFEPVGRIDDHPPGHSRIFMRKRWG